MDHGAHEPPYRGMDRVDLDADAREHDAIAAFGRWRMGVRSQSITVACVIGGIAGAAGFFVAQQIQLAMIQRAWIGINVGGFLIPFALSLLVGLAIARVRVAAGTERVICELSERYQIDPARIEEVAAQVGQL
jgi:hypothetical protein